MGTIGIDLGTSNVLLCEKKKGIFVRQPSVVALNHATGKVIAVGTTAQQMLERTPESISAVSPIQNGRIADPEMCKILLKNILDNNSVHKIRKPDVIFAVPSDITPLEERTMIEIGFAIGARKTYLVESVLAAAIGAGIDFEKPEGRAVIDLGGGICNIGVLSLGGIVRSATFPLGGNRFNAEIIRQLRSRHHLVIGERTAEDIKIKISGVQPRDSILQYEVRGKNLKDGYVGNITLSSVEVGTYFPAILAQLLDEIRCFFENIPTELLSDIQDNGIILTGGGSLIWGMAAYIQHYIGIHAQIAEDPISACARGLLKIIESRRRLSPGIQYFQRQKVQKL